MCYRRQTALLIHNDCDNSWRYIKLLLGATASKTHYYSTARSTLIPHVGRQHRCCRASRELCFNYLHMKQQRLLPVRLMGVDSAHHCEYRARIGV